VHHGRIVKRTGDGNLVEFRSVVDAVRCAIEMQNGLIERNAGLPSEGRIEFRIGIHLGDVVEEADGDVMGDGVNIAARLESIAKPGAICLSEQAFWQVKGRLDLAVHDLGPTQLKNITEPIRVYSLVVGEPAGAKSAPAWVSENSASPRLSIVVLPFANIGATRSRSISSMGSRRASRPTSHGYEAPSLSPAIRRSLTRAGNPTRKRSGAS
jgi:adenylate cyclase